MTNRKTTAPVIALMINCGIATAAVKPDQGQEPTGDDCTDNADHDVARETKSIALHDLARCPAGLPMRSMPP